jgi:hypothetical protein
MSSQKWVTSRTPKTFIAYGSSDVTVSVNNSLLFDSALTKNGITHKTFVEAGKTHGYAMTGVWQDTCLAWLKAQGIVPTSLSKVIGRGQVKTLEEPFSIIYKNGFINSTEFSKVVNFLN